MPDQNKKLFYYKTNRVWAENLTLVLQIGLTMAGCILFCFFIGLKLDQWIGTKGLFAVIFLILGFIGGANVVYRQVLAITPNKKDKNHIDASD
jgi:F0F1-type ATP synthase assembly protein I